MEIGLIHGRLHLHGEIASVTLSLERLLGDVTRALVFRLWPCQSMSLETSDMPKRPKMPEIVDVWRVLESWPPGALMVCVLFGSSK